MSAPATTPGQRFPPGTSLALRPTRRRQGHLVSWLPRGQLPPPPLLPPGMRGSWKPGAEPSVSGNHCKTTTPLGWGQRPSVCCERGSQRTVPGTCPPAPGPGLRFWARALTVPCTGMGGLAGCRDAHLVGQSPAMSHKCLAGPRSAPVCPHAEGCGVNTGCSQDEI